MSRVDGCPWTILSENEVFMNSTFSVLSDSVLDTFGHLRGPLLKLQFTVQIFLPLSLDLWLLCGAPVSVERSSVPDAFSQDSTRNSIVKTSYLFLFNLSRGVLFFLPFSSCCSSQSSLFLCDFFYLPSRLCAHWLSRFLNFAIDILAALQILRLRCLVRFYCELASLLHKHEAYSLSALALHKSCLPLLVVMILSISLQTVFGSDWEVYVSMFLRSKTWNLVWISSNPWTFALGGGSCF